MINKALQRAGAGLDLADLFSSATSMFGGGQQQDLPQRDQSSNDLAAAASVLASANPVTALIRGALYPRELGAGNAYTPQQMREQDQQAQQVRDAETERYASEWAKRQMQPWQNAQQETEYNTGKTAGLQGLRPSLQGSDAYERGLASGTALRDNAPSDSPVTRPTTVQGRDSLMSAAYQEPYGPVAGVDGILMRTDVSGPKIVDPGAQQQAPSWKNADLGDVGYLRDTGGLRGAGSSVTAPRARPEAVAATPSPLGGLKPTYASPYGAEPRAKRQEVGTNGFVSTTLSDGRTAVMRPDIAAAYRDDYRTKGAAPTIYREKPTYDSSGRMTNNQNQLGTTATHIGGSQLLPQTNLDRDRNKL